MSRPRLYEQYDRREAIAFFGGEAEARELCDGQWVILPNVVICLTTIGDPPAMSHFTTGSRFFWVADNSYQVSNGQFNTFLPIEVIGSKAKIRSIYLFVCPQQSQKYVYIGELEPSYVQTLPGSGGFGMAQFEFRPTLPSGVWAQLSGFQVGFSDPVEVDRALNRLRELTTVEDRLEVLRILVEYWHGPIRPEDAISESELAPFRLPRPLKWWYRWAGRRGGILSGQNILFSPKNEKHKYWELRVEDDRLLFYIENQGCYWWATLPEGDDPPVFGRWESSDPWVSENITLSEHLILCCLFEAVVCHARYGASTAWLEEATLNEIVKILPPIAIAPWRWPGETRFYAGSGAFMCAAKFAIGDATGYSVWIAAKTEGPLQFLKRFIDEEWEFIAL